MDRETALKAIQENVKNENLIKHMLATEAIMRALARRFTENEHEWGLAGLLHDIDVELTHADLKVHSKPGRKWQNSWAQVKRSVVQFLSTTKRTESPACQ